MLAGDTCKEASDLGLPLVAIGFMYPQGYFHQQISADGWQEEIYRMLDFDEAPVNPCPWPQGCGPLVQVQLGSRILHIWTWQIQVGRVYLYLLDTNVEQNSLQDRQLCNDTLDYIITTVRVYIDYAYSIPASCSSAAN